MIIYAQMVEDSLNVNVTIKESSDDTVVIANASMVNVSSSFFKYDFSTAVEGKDYYFIAKDTDLEIEAYGTVSTAPADVNVVEVQGTTVESIEDFKAATVDFTVVLQAIAELHDITPEEVRAAFDATEFKDKNTEAEIHSWLDSYQGKDDWKGSLSEENLTVISDSVWSKVV